jgi:hypothetical protein
MQLNFLIEGGKKIDSMPCLEEITAAIGHSANARLITYISIASKIPASYLLNQLPALTSHPEPILARNAVSVIVPVFKMFTWGLIRAI